MSLFSRIPELERPRETLSMQPRRHERGMSFGENIIRYFTRKKHKRRPLLLVHPVPVPRLFGTYYIEVEVITFPKQPLPTFCIGFIDQPTAKSRMYSPYDHGARYASLGNFSSYFCTGNKYALFNTRTGIQTLRNLPFERSERSYTMGVLISYTDSRITAYCNGRHLYEADFAADPTFQDQSFLMFSVFPSISGGFRFNFGDQPYLFDFSAVVQNYLSSNIAPLLKLTIPSAIYLDALADRFSQSVDLGVYQAFELCLNECLTERSLDPIIDELDLIKVVPVVFGNPRQALYVETLKSLIVYHFHRERPEMAYALRQERLDPFCHPVLARKYDLNSIYVNLENTANEFNFNLTITKLSSLTKAILNPLFPSILEKCVRHSKLLINRALVHSLPFPIAFEDVYKEHSITFDITSEET